MLDAIPTQAIDRAIWEELFQREYVEGQTLLPEYSTQIGHAFTVLLYLQEHPNEVLPTLTLRGATPEKLQWFVRLRECRGWQHDFYGESATAPMAICLAALSYMADLKARGEK